MFHRFHDLKTGQDPDMIGGGSRSNTPTESGSSRSLFPSVIRSELNVPNHQLRVNPQYPITSTPGTGYMGQGAPLMSFGHNLMFQPGKLLSSPSQEAHRYMSEAYRIATSNLDPTISQYGMATGRPQMQMDQQAMVSDLHIGKVPPPTVTTPGPAQERPLAAENRLPSERERELYNPLTLKSPQISTDNAPRGLPPISYDASRLAPSIPTNKDDGKVLHYEKTISYSASSAASASEVAPLSAKGKSPPAPIAGSHMFHGSYPPTYDQYHESTSGSFKRQYYDDSSGPRRENLPQPHTNRENIPLSTRESLSQPNRESLPLPNRESLPQPSRENILPPARCVEDSSQLNREEERPRSDEQMQEEAGVSGGCIDNVDVYGSDDLSRNVRQGDDAGLLDHMVRVASPSQIGAIDRPKMMKGRQFKAYLCPICHMEFKNATQLRNHSWRHTGEKPFVCEECQATFTQQSNLKTHMRIHTGERPYKCEECNATFTQISNLRTHQKIHTGEKPYECDVCFTRFSQQSNLKSHKLIHTGERPFVCDECGATFIQSTHLRNHRRIHTDERPYACDQCGSSFRQLSNLKTHEKIHTGERPHVCEDCGSAFAQKSNLKSHMMKLHSNDGTPVRRGRKKKLEAIVPHICEECGAKFTMMSNLKIHMRLHTGEKPYGCDLCPAKFAQRSNLKSHEQIHTDERPYKCTECSAAFRQKTNLKTHKMKKHPVRSLKIKILNDSQYIMNDIMQEIIQGEEDHDGGPSPHIEEPIVQISEGGEEHLSLGVGQSMIKSERGERYDDHSEEIMDNSVFRSGNMGVGDMNPYDSPHF